ncbi:hypothetical protein D9758_008119 [Tetrapyrgos nigripes]|uniref:Ribonuclease H1 N-terminal domain-containing protein n=1 Tax=Tetrapyrgos nigripes TaxID=182062 RepID=A0A8H5GHP6_9AGAR|nr:hypothetical protein D9758_008119 [Tetrapyrgos nigripes]
MKGQAFFLPSLKNIAEHFILDQKASKGKGKAKDNSTSQSRAGGAAKLIERYETLAKQRRDIDIELKNIQDQLDSSDSSSDSSDGNSHLYVSDSDDSIGPYIVGVVESESKFNAAPPYTSLSHTASSTPSTPSHTSRPALTVTTSRPAPTVTMSRPAPTITTSRPHTTRSFAARPNALTARTANATPIPGSSSASPSNPPTPCATKAKPKYKKNYFGYVVYRGRETGAFKFWNMVQSIIANDSIVLYKGFPTFQAAREVYSHTQDTGVINALSLPATSTPHCSQSQEIQDNRIYVVTEGPSPGVYQDAFSALERGLQWDGGALHPKDTVAEANRFFVTEFMGGRVQKEMFAKATTSPFIKIS